MKNLLKSIFLVAILLVIGINAGAQVPGYMGKRTVVGYGFYFNPAFSNIALDYGDNPVNTLHEFFLERTTKKRFAFGLSVRLYRYTYNNIESVNPTGSSSYYSYNSYHPTGNYLIKGRNFNLYGKFFGWRYLAPWGKYFTLGLSYTAYSTTYDPAQMRVQVRQSNGSYTNYSNFGAPTQTYSQADITIGNGNSRIFGDKFVVDYGYTINTLAMARILVNAFDFGEPILASEYIGTTSTKRVAAINRFNFYIKVGYLF